jgi:hypothetical protein
VIGDHSPANGVSAALTPIPLSVLLPEFGLPSPTSHPVPPFPSSLEGPDTIPVRPRQPPIVSTSLACSPSVYTTNSGPDGRTTGAAGEAGVESELKNGGCSRKYVKFYVGREMVKAGSDSRENVLGAFRRSSVLKMIEWLVHVHIFGAHCLIIHSFTCLGKFLTVREGLTGPKEASFAGTDRQNCQKLWLLCFSRWPVLLCSRVSPILTIKKRSQRWLNVESEPLSAGVITEAHVNHRSTQRALSGLPARVLEVPSQGNFYE